MGIRWLAAGMLAASTTGLLAGQARADGGFGRAGTVSISADQPLLAGTVVATSIGLGAALALPTALAPIGVEQISGSDNGGSATLFSFAPQLDYFVTENLSVGGQVMVGVVSSSPAGGNGSTTTLYGFAPQVGYNLRLGDRVSIWPKVFFAYWGDSGNGESASEGTLGVFAPILFHAARHFYFGGGPNVSTQLFVNGAGGLGTPPKLTTFGAMATFGGWLGS